MHHSTYRESFISTSISLLVVSIFVVWAAIDGHSLHKILYEDGPIEMMTAGLFGLSGICFIVFAIRSDFLKKEKGWERYFFTISWAILMFIFMGEEISWGQRIFDFGTPEAISKVNVQDEINIHNLGFFYKLGGEYRVISIIILTTGLLLPLFAAGNFGKRTIQRFAFPVAPLGYSVLFVGAYLYGRYCKIFFPNLNDASEVREFLWSAAMFCFTMHGAISPCTLFRVCISKRKDTVSVF